MTDLSVYFNTTYFLYRSTQVVVVQNPTSDSAKTYSDLKPYSKGVTVYIAAAWNESDLVPNEFTIGDISDHGDDHNYTNEALKSNTRYGYFIRYVIENDTDATNVSLINTVHTYL